MNRCAICDYTIEEGSEYADRAPGLLSIRERPNEGQGEFLCDECADAVDENLSDLSIDDIDEDEVH